MGWVVADDAECLVLRLDFVGLAVLLLLLLLVRDGAVVGLIKSLGNNPLCVRSGFFCGTSTLLLLLLLGLSG